eukprot:m.295717 g.295717  ORF g.295717 m.295717 type:complete len:713 (-) comp16272_c0_seq1:237-2375(-)
MATADPPTTAGDGGGLRPESDEASRNHSPGLRLSGLDSGFVRAAITLDPSHVAPAWDFFAASNGKCCHLALIDADGAHNNTPTHGPSLTPTAGHPREASGTAATAAAATPQDPTRIPSKELAGNVVLSSVHIKGNFEVKPIEAAFCGSVRLLHHESGGVAGETAGQLVCLYALSNSVGDPESALSSILEPFAAAVECCVVCAEPELAQAIVLIWFMTSAAGLDFVATMNGQPFDRDRASEQCHAMVLTDLVVGASAAAVSRGLDQCFEIPRCPVCLERLDETVGPTLLQPLTRGALAPCWRRIWEKCRVCTLLRGQAPRTDRDPSREVSSADLDRRTGVSHLHARALHGTACTRCGEPSRLWACMVCAYVGCSRPQYGADTEPETSGAAVGGAGGAEATGANQRRNGHMLEHWLGTGGRHNLAVDLGSQWVWDYQRDGFVHHSEHVDSPPKSAHPHTPAGHTARSEGGGWGVWDGRQPVPAPLFDANPTSTTTADSDALAERKQSGPDASVPHPHTPHAAAGFPTDNKAERITTEYVGLLSLQLESQRLYFAETAAATKATARAKVAALQTELAAVQAENRALEAQIADGSGAVDAAVKAQRESTGLLSSAFEALRAERSRCQKLMAEQATWQAQLERARAAVEAEERTGRDEAARLREDNADLQAAVAMQKEIRDAPPEVQRELKEGTLVPGNPAPDTPRKGKRRPKGKGR